MKDRYTLYLCSKLFCLHKQTLIESGDDVSLKLLRERAKKQRRKLNSKEREKIQEAEAEAEAEMQKLCRIKDKIARLQDVLQRFQKRRCRRSNTSSLDELLVVYIPVAELQEKR